MFVKQTDLTELQKPCSLNWDIKLNKIIHRVYSESSTTEFLFLWYRIWELHFVCGGDGEKHVTQTMGINIVSQCDSYTTGSDQCVKAVSVVVSRSEACLSKEMKGLCACVIRPGWVFFLSLLWCSITLAAALTLSLELQLTLALVGRLFISFLDVSHICTQPPTGDEASEKVCHPVFHHIWSLATKCVICVIINL